jgi:hypothetical protein
MTRLPPSLKKLERFYLKRDGNLIFKRRKDFCAAGERVSHEVPDIGCVIFRLILKSRPPYKARDCPCQK